MKTATVKKKDEFRYQFLRYEEVGTGKFTKHPFYNFGGLGQPLGELSKIQSYNYKEIKKTIAMVFDKQTGEVKQTEIKKL